MLFLTPLVREWPASGRLYEHRKRLSEPFFSFFSFQNVLSSIFEDKLNWFPKAVLI